MTISPEALEKARAVAQSICDNTRTLIGENDIIFIATALQAERDAAAPKLPDDLAGLVAELRDAARLNAGPLGPEARAEHRALTAIQSLVARNAELRAEIAALKKEAAAFAEKVQDYSNDGHLARAARSFLDKWEGRDV